MQVYVIRRIIQMIPLLIGVSMLSFFVLNLSPGDFLAEMQMNPDISDQIIAQLRAEFGLDQPVWVQYFNWLGNLLQFNLGYSFAYRIPVGTLIGFRIMNTFRLSLASLLLAWVVAIPVGVHAAVNRYTARDNFLTFLTFLGISIPNFFLGLILLYFVATTDWINLPTGGMTAWYHDELGFWAQVWDYIRHLILPTIVLATATMAGWMRQMRGQMMDALSADYVRTARSKGLSERIVLYKHALRNAINPLITMAGFAISALLSGAAITEVVFSYPGLGNMLLNAVLQKDLYVAMAGLMMGSVLLILGNLIADLMLAVVDPRIRYD